MTKHAPARPLPDVDALILTVRDQKVLLDVDLAFVYGVPTRVLNQALKRNLGRFPADFAFQLTAEETAGIRSQTVIASHRSQLVTASKRTLGHAVHCFPQPQRGCVTPCRPAGRNPVGVGFLFHGSPRVARASQPWADGRCPVGAKQPRVRRTTESRTLATLRDTLLPKLLSGEVRV